MSLVDAIFAVSALLLAVAALTFALIFAFDAAERWSIRHRAKLVVREANRELLRHQRP